MMEAEALGNHVPEQLGLQNETLYHLSITNMKKISTLKYDNILKFIKMSSLHNTRAIYKER